MKFEYLSNGKTRKKNMFFLFIQIIVLTKKRKRKEKNIFVEILFYFRNLFPSKCKQSHKLPICSSLTVIEWLREKIKEDKIKILKQLKYEQLIFNQKTWKKKLWTEKRRKCVYQYDSDAKYLVFFFLEKQSNIIKTQGVVNLQTPT